MKPEVDPNLIVFFGGDYVPLREARTLSDGLVLGDVIECPRHQGRFHIPTGKAKGAPVCVNLQTYPTKVEGHRVYLGLPELVS